MDDEAEAERLRILKATVPMEGYGEVLTAEDIKSYSIQDFVNFGIRDEGD